MNVLILTGRFGMGHVKCAEAIKEEIMAKDNNSKVTVIDFCDQCFPHISKLIYKGFELCVFRFYDAYNLLLSASNKLNCAPFKRFIFKKFERIMNNYAPDLVVANLPICVHYFSLYKEAQSIKIPLYVYITDITVHSDWISRSVDHYFVGDKVCKHELVCSGIRPENIHICGIPVSASFSNPGDNIIKATEILIMGGGLGLIPCHKKILSSLNNEPGIKTTIICGKNEALRTKITAKYKNITAVGFVENVSEHLKRSDVIITKPGGITTFEAIMACTPLYVIEPTLEHEIGNSLFIKENGLGIVVSNCEDFSASDLLSFVNDTEAISRIKENMRKITDSFESSNPMDYIEAA